MRVFALLTDAYGGLGGIAKFNRDLLEAICSFRDCDEVVTLCRHLGPDAEPVPDKVRLIAKAGGGRRSFIRAAIAACLRTSRFDLVLCGHIHFTPLALACRILTGAPTVLVIHGIEAWTPNRSFLVNFAARRTSVVIAVSELTQQRFERWCRSESRRSFLLPNSVDFGRFSPGPPDPELVRRYGLEKRRVIMTLGRLAGQERFKGFDEVIAALPKLLQDVPDLAYLIVGEGDDRLRLEQLARDLGVDGRVVFAGLVPEKEKAAHYRLADAFVLASRGEGFGIVLLEAMACGIPVVASKLDGGKEALRGGTLGTLVDPRDPGDVRRGICEALSRPKGVRPDGLDFFASIRFEERVHRILGDLDD